jgi:hypothetical protein
MSESAASCALNTVAASNIGWINLNEERINQFFGVKDLKLDTTSLAKSLPIF